MSRTILVTMGALTGLLGACGDSQSSSKLPDAESIEIRDLGAVVDADLTNRRDATPLDLGPPPADLLELDAHTDLAVEWDFAPRPDAASCSPTVLSAEGGSAPLTAGTGDATSADGGTFWRVQVVDPRGRALEAQASLVVSAEAFTLIVHAPGYLAAVLSAPLESRTYGVNAARQATEGPGTKEVLGASEVPDCATGTRFISVLAALAPLPDRLVRELAGEALADACAPGGGEPPESPACSTLARIRDALVDLPARLRLSADSHPSYGEAGLARLAGPAAAALLGDTCGSPWGVAPVAFLDDAAAPLPDQAAMARWRRLTDAYTRQSALLAPGDAVAADRLFRFGLALVRLAGVVSPIGFDLLSVAPEFVEQNGLTAAAAAVRAVVAAGDAAAPAAVLEPLRGFVAGVAAPAFDGFAFARSAEPAGAYGLGPAALCDLGVVRAFVVTGEALQIDSAPAVSAMLDVLEAAASGWGQAPIVDAGPSADAGVPAADAALPADAAVAPSPDAGPVGVCGPDDSEPNQSWEQEVAEGERLARNVSELRQRTLEPGNDDWYDFEAGLLNPHLSAALSAEPLCESPGGRLCGELLWWTWAYAEGLLDNTPFTLVARTCADIADGLVLDAGGIAGLAGEPWTSMVIHVTEDADAPLAAPLPYRIRVTR